MKRAPRLRSGQAPQLALVAVQDKAPTLADRLVSRAYRVLYRPGERNRCPGCAGTSWWVGRSNAECAGCGAIVPIAADGSEGGSGA